MGWGFNRGGGIDGSVPQVGEGARRLRDNKIGTVTNVMDSAGTTYLEVTYSDGTKSAQRPHEVAPTDLHK